MGVFDSNGQELAAGSVFTKKNQNKIE